MLNLCRIYIKNAKKSIFGEKFVVQNIKKLLEIIISFETVNLCNFEYEKNLTIEKLFDLIRSIQQMKFLYNVNVKNKKVFSLSK